MHIDLCSRFPVALVEGEPVRFNSLAWFLEGPMGTSTEFKTLMPRDCTQSKSFRTSLPSGQLVPAGRSRVVTMTDYLEVKAIDIGSRTPAKNQRASRRDH